MKTSKLTTLITNLFLHSRNSFCETGFNLLEQKESRFVPNGWNILNYDKELFEEACMNACMTRKVDLYSVNWAYGPEGELTNIKYGGEEFDIATFTEECEIQMVVYFYQFRMVKVPQSRMIQL